MKKLVLFAALGLCLSSIAEARDICVTAVTSVEFRSQVAVVNEVVVDGAVTNRLTGMQPLNPYAQGVVNASIDMLAHPSLNKSCFEL